MRKNLPLYILLCFLIVVNAFFLYNYLGSGEKGQEPLDRKPPDAFLADELGFEDAQKQQFRALSREHRQHIRGISDDIRALKDALFSGLSDASLESINTDSITTLIGKKEKQRELLTFNYFNEVQELCTAEQKEKFRKIIKDALRRGMRGQGPPPGGRPDGNRPPPPRDRDGDRRPPEHQN